MDNQGTILVGGGVGVAFSVVTFIVFRLVVPFISAANHKRIRSVCCGKTCVSSLDVDETTPTPHHQPDPTIVTIRTPGT